MKGLARLPQVFGEMHQETVCVKMLKLFCVLGYSTVPGSQCGSDPGLVTSQLYHKTSLDLSFLTYKMEIIILCSKIIVRRIDGILDP